MSLNNVSHLVNFFSLILFAYQNFKNKVAKRYKSGLWNSHAVNLSKLMNKIGEGLCSNGELSKENKWLSTTNFQPRKLRTLPPVSLNPFGARVFWEAVESIISSSSDSF